MSICGDRHYIHTKHSISKRKGPDRVLCTKDEGHDGDHYDANSWIGWPEGATQDLDDALGMEEALQEERRIMMGRLS